MTQGFTINSKYGIGEVISQDEKNTTVYFSEVEKTCTLMNSIVKIYPTYEIAEIALEEGSAAAEAKIAEIKNIDISASVWLSAKNLENAKNNLPSSLR